MSQKPIPWHHNGSAWIPCTSTRLTDNPNPGCKQRFEIDHNRPNESCVYTSGSRALPKRSFVYTQLSSLQIPLSRSRHPRVRKVTLSQVQCAANTSRYGLSSPKTHRLQACVGCLLRLLGRLLESVLGLLSSDRLRQQSVLRSASQHRTTPEVTRNARGDPLPS